MAAEDTFTTYNAGLESPAAKAFSITPSDASQLSFVTRGIRVAGAGNLRVDMAGGGSVTFFACAAAELLPIRVTKVYSTSTTATSLVGLY